LVSADERSSQRDRGGSISQSDRGAAIDETPTAAASATPAGSSGQIRYQGDPPLDRNPAGHVRFGNLELPIVGGGAIA
jgi:hypothetical protein